jgi:hypothetical protein
MLGPPQSALASGLPRRRREPEANRSLRAIGPTHIRVAQGPKQIDAEPGRLVRPPSSNPSATASLRAGLNVPPGALGSPSPAAYRS